MIELPNAILLGLALLWTIDTLGHPLNSGTYKIWGAVVAAVFLILGLWV